MDFDRSVFVFFWSTAGQLGTLPGTRQVATSGIATFDAEEAADTSVPAGQEATGSGDSSTTTHLG